MPGGAETTAMFERLGHLVVRRTKLILVLYFVLLAAFAGTGWQVFGELKSAGYDNPKSESFRAEIGRAHV